MKLHTLGPKTTDSYYAYLYWIDKNKLDINLLMHNSFEDIYGNLSNYKNDLFLVPTLYRDNRSDWAIYHYQYIEQLKIYDTFVLNTKPMVLIRNKKIHNKKIGLHKATEPFLFSYEVTAKISLKREFEDSKSIAQKNFLNDELEYAIISETSEINQPNFQVVKRYTPQIIWCIYKII